MAKDPDPNEIRFPLRRSDVKAEPTPPPAPAKPKRVPIPWKPRAVDAEPQQQWFERAAPPPPPSPPPPPQRAPAFDPLELTDVAPPAQPRAWTGWAATPPPPPPPGAWPQQSDLPPEDYTTNLPVAYKRRWWRWVPRAAAAFIVLFVIAFGWLALTAPLSKSLQPPAPPSITLLASDGVTPIARRGAVIGAAVDVEKMPAYVSNAFVAIEDRRFYSHWGVDPRGIARALVHNASSDGGSQGGSTITQQLAKNAFLNSNRTIGRKLQEVMISFWLEGWLTKKQILSRYLSYVYFGDNVYGLTAAARHYFNCNPEDLTLSQATLLAGLVQAPSRLAPTGNLKGARARQKLVIAAMADTGMITKAEAKATPPATLNVPKEKELPNGGYFADWVMPAARDQAGGVATEQNVTTTLDMRAQKSAERAVKNAALKKAQIAIVAMRPDGQVIAMVGGNNYGASPFNRVTQARRQPGSAFKLFVYLTALRNGMKPDDIVDDSPVKIGDWAPDNHGGSYAGKITLRQALAKSSNVVAARLIQKFGVRAVTQTARDLGISTPIGNDASIALGTSTVSPLELTAAYAAIARGSYPVRPRGLEAIDEGWGAMFSKPTAIPAGQLEDMRDLLGAVVTSGTGRGASLSVPTFGKTGTTQDSRDAWFVGYAGEGENAVVAGVWIGNDDNSPNGALAGGGLPARVWRDFMTGALGVQAAAPPEEVIDNETGNDSVIDQVMDGIGNFVGDGTVETEIDTRDPADRLPPTPGPTPAPVPTPRREDALAPSRPPVDDRRAPGPQPTRVPTPTR